MLVIRYCGPRGYPGMPEVSNVALPKKLLLRGVRDMVRICDGRMSGTAYGTVVLHVAPEAAAGGPLALVRTGDWITLDVPARTLTLEVSEEELAGRRAGWQPARAARQPGLDPAVQRARAAGRRRRRPGLPGRRQRARGAARLALTTARHGLRPVMFTSAPLPSPEPAGRSPWRASSCWMRPATPAARAAKAAVHHDQHPAAPGVLRYLFNPAGQFLLTRRAESKRTLPGVWTNTCCGHPEPGEPCPDSVRRRLRQELGIAAAKLALVLPGFRYQARMANGVLENEVCPVYAAYSDEAPAPDPAEVAETRWVDWAEFCAAVRAGRQPVSPWCAMQLAELTALGPDPLAWAPGDAAALPPPPSRRPDRKMFQRSIVGVLAAGPDVAEERAALDQVADGLGHHGLPGAVLRGDPAQHVTAEDGQVLGAVVVQVDEAAPAGQVVIQRLELGLDLDVVTVLQLVVRCRPVSGRRTASGRS